MADNTKSSQMLVPQKSGTVRDAINRIKLVLRLLGDRRVSALIKLIPIGALAYLISPVDLAPGIALPVIGALDDAAIVWLGTYLFVELCPPDVVKEHLKALTSNLSNESNDEVVDGETTDMTE
jgi:uncharacterized membrane protein YkvA (DUF1232 family)